VARKITYPRCAWPVTLSVAFSEDTLIAVVSSAVAPVAPAKDGAVVSGRASAERRARMEVDPR
jgi:hypothetical protein